MSRWITITLLAVSFSWAGCSKSPDEVAATQNTPAVPAADTTPEARQATNQPSPTDVVSQFLDQVRRGGDDSMAGTLLTERARSELKRVGLPIDPFGAPDAKYTVTRSEMVPGQDTAALVHSVWSDPNEDGGSADSEVVWLLVQESAGWRISGMAIQTTPGEEPMLIDFEDGDEMLRQMANLLGPEAEEADAAATQASAPATTDIK